MPRRALLIALGGLLFLGCKQRLLFGFLIGALGLGHSVTPGPKWACLAGTETSVQYCADLKAL